MANYKKIIITTNSYSVTDMVGGTTPICDTKVLNGSSWTFNSNELPATVYYETNVAQTNKRLLFASDTDHITDSGSILQSRINRVFYKNMCKEFTSNGEAITVNNGMDGYVLSATIQGQTFKQAIDYTKSIPMYGTYANNVYTPTSLNVNARIDFNNLNIQANTQYYYSFMIKSTKGLNCNISIGGTTSQATILTANTLTKISGSLTTQATEQYVRFYFNKNNLLELTDTVEIYNFICIETTKTKDEMDKTISNQLPFGLSSTQATISNLGLKYSFYMSLEDKLANLPIALGGLEGARNTFEIKEDGSAIYAQNNMRKILDGTGNWVIDSAINQVSTICFGLASDGTTDANNVNCICDSLISKAGGQIYSQDVESCASAYGRLYIRILKSKLATQDVAGIKAYLQSNPVTIIYKLATPIVTTIDKSLVPAILTQLQNQFTFGDAVAPYSTTIKLPTSDDIAKSYSLTLLNGYTQTVNTSTPIVDLLKDGKVRLQMDLTAPSTGMNATLFAVAPELRPVTNQKIPVFVNGVCQLATIDKTTGNVNLASVPSASANVYIKTDYRRDI